MKSLVEQVSKFKGNVVCLCVDDDNILKSLNKNDKINAFMISRDESKSFFRRKKAKSNTGKKINIKKLRKTFKKKSVNYTVIKYNGVMDYYKHIIYDSIYMCKGEIYIYGNTKHIDPKSIVRPYKRVKLNVELEVDGDSFIIKIEVGDKKVGYLKSKLYLILDTFHNIGDMISVALTS